MTPTDTAQAAVTAAREADCEAARRLHLAEARHPYSGTPAIHEARARKQETWKAYRAALVELRDAEHEEDRS